MKVTGTALYILTVGLTGAAFFNLCQAHTSSTTLWGIIVSFELRGIGMLDSLEAFCIAILSLRERREAFGKAAGVMAFGCQGSCGERS